MSVLGFGYRLGAWRWRSVAAAFVLLVAGCVAESGFSRTVLGYEGLGRQIVAYYDNRAVERNYTCTLPKMNTILTVSIVEETEDKLIINVRYSWRQEGRENFGGFTSGLATTCRGRSERRFDLTKYGDDHVVIVAMSGPQSS